MKKNALAKYIDHTLLKPDATEAQIEQLCAEAREYGFASVCVNTGYLPLCRKLLKEERDTGVKCCVVIGFPVRYIHSHYGIASLADFRNGVQLAVEMIRRLTEAGVQPEKAETRSGSAFAGMSIVVTGTLPTLSRKEAEDLIRREGGTAAGSVSKKTAFVVAGENAGSKLTKAQSLGIEIIGEEELLRRAADG